VFLFLLLVIAALAYVVFNEQLWERITAAPASSEAPVAEPVDVTLEELLDRAVDNGDGTITVTITEAEAGGLVRDGLQRGATPTLREVTVDLQDPGGSAPGQMQINGRLPEQDVPVTVIVDLAASGGNVEPTVRDARLGPLPVPGGVREDLNGQLQGVSLLGARQVDVERLHTTEQELVVTGRRR
jgi:hypothetical protein